MGVSLRALWSGVRVRRTAAAAGRVARVVLPDEPYVPEGPWVRPTHSGGLTSGPKPEPAAAAQVVRPRRPHEEPALAPLDAPRA